MFTGCRSEISTTQPLILAGPEWCDVPLITWQYSGQIVPSTSRPVLTQVAARTADLIDATNIDRLHIGPLATLKLDWLQPHEGNIVDFLFRARAIQMPAERLAALA